MAERPSTRLNVFYGFGHPEHSALGEWISDEVAPLHDHYRTPDASPQSARMTWADQRIEVVKWQGEVWIAQKDLPRLMSANEDRGLSDRPSWRRLL
ncbi:hypothetical protein D3C84_763730 [compost metagenome]